MSDKNCENCNAVLTGPYCSACGQHAHASARTLQALLHDVFHDLTHFEGRVWTSLKFLVTQPGRLTQEYFSGRRNRFAPPFRLYLVVSVLFFALSSSISMLARCWLRPSRGLPGRPMEISKRLSSITDPAIGPWNPWFCRTHGSP